MKNIPVLTFPTTYTEEEKQSIASKAQESIEKGTVIVIPEGVNIYSITVTD